MSDYWKDNNIKKPAEIIVCAANRNSDGVIICGARHWDMIMRTQAKFIRFAATDHWDQGFVNQFGEFRSRKEAFAIVSANGQPFDQSRNGSTDELYSEGLY